jgi:3-oxoacyl-[acyl-carrier protein] reductase
MKETKSVLVTGSSRGIGEGLVRGFAGKGYGVAVNYARAESEARKIHDELTVKYGREKVLLVKADVSNRAEVCEMFDVIQECFGKVDILVNNAGLNIDGPFLKMTDEQWRRVIDVNLTGTFICSQEFALRFKGEEGHIINIGAGTAFKGRQNGVNYCAAKAGVVNLTKCLALELAPKIRVNCIVPGYIDTEEVMTRFDLHRKDNYDEAVTAIPLQRLGTAEDIFNTAWYIVEDSTYVTGANFFVNGGNFLY